MGTVVVGAVVFPVVVAGVVGGLVRLSVVGAVVVIPGPPPSVVFFWDAEVPAGPWVAVVFFGAVEVPAGPILVLSRVVLFSRSSVEAWLSFSVALVSPALVAPVVPAWEDPVEDPVEDRSTLVDSLVTSSTDSSIYTVSPSSLVS